MRNSAAAIGFRWFTANSMYYVYLLRCCDNTLYCGYTTDINKRVNTHNAGKGAKYTKSRRPVVLVYFEQCETKSEALRREAQIKKMPREKKELLIKESCEID